REQLATERAKASAERSRVDAQLRGSVDALDALRNAEEQVRHDVALARNTLDEMERALRDAQDRLHQADLARASAQRELDDVEARRAQLERERAHLADTASLARRELEDGVVARDAALTRVGD